MDLVAELDAKAVQSTRHQTRHRTPSRREDHVCYRAAREIEALRHIKDAPEAERGWRTFWGVIVSRLNLDRDQRTYGWHELMDACKLAIDTVKQRS